MTNIGNDLPHATCRILSGKLRNHPFTVRVTSDKIGPR